MSIIHNIIKFFKPDPPPPPPPPPPRRTEPPVNQDARRLELRQLGINNRDRIERVSNQPPQQILPQPPPTPDEQARQGAREVEAAFNAHPNVVISAPGQGRDPNEPSAQAAAAQRLREVTAAQPPEIAAETIRYSQPTIDRIGSELGRTAQQHDGGYGSDKPQFDAVVNDLAAAANRAAPAPNGQAAVEQIARSVVNGINPNDVGRFDEALGKPIGNGTGGELTGAVIKQLQASGRVDQADDIMENVEDGINQLHERAADLSSDVKEKNEELAWLVNQWKPLMTEQQLNNAVQSYKDANPQYVANLRELDQTAVSMIRAIDTFGSAPRDFAGLGHSDDVQNAIADMLKDEDVRGVIPQSTSASAEIERIMGKDANNPNELDFFDQVASVAGKSDDLKYFRETILNKTLDSTINRSYDAARARNFDEVDRLLGQLNQKADKLGYSNEQFRNIIQQLGRVSRAESPEEAATDLRVLARKIDSFKQSNPEVFTNGNRFDDKFKRFGLMLGTAGTAASIYQAYNDPNTFSVASALTDAAGLGADAAQTEMVKRALSGRSLYDGIPLGTIGKAAGGLSLILDTIGVIKDLSEHKYVDAGLGGASAVGGAMMIFGGAAVTGVGAVIVGAAIIGKFIYDDIAEANKHETDGARAFLQGAGMTPETANELINNDDDGRSPAPVLAALAQNRSVDPRRMFDYVSHLPPETAKRLIETAHGVDPDENGVFPVEKRNPVYFGGRAGSRVDNSPNDLTDLVNWMRANGYANAPGL